MNEMLRAYSFALATVNTGKTLPDSGVRESNVQDAWTVEAQGLEIVEAETDIVRSFLRNFRNIPVGSALLQTFPLRILRRIKRHALQL